ncbi:Calcium channel flower [Aphelenchoides fujianensis]|nr:Calcium channel flower [Aphelenchoides fujianensis]
MQAPPLSWWARASGGGMLGLAARGVGLLGGVFGLMMGVVGLFTFYIFCLIAAFCLLIAGSTVIVLEGAVFLSFVDFGAIKQVAAFSAARPHWQKAILYCTIGAMPFFMCFWWHTFLGGCFTFAAGIIYGVMAFRSRNTQSTTTTSNPTFPAPPPNPFFSSPSDPNAAAPPRAFNQP